MERGIPLIAKICFFVIGLSVGWFLHHFGIAFYLRKYPLGICDYCEYYQKKENCRIERQ